MTRILYLAVAVATALALIPGPSLAQERPKPPEEKPKPPKKAKKVWTEDDIAVVRKPWDDYQDQRAAEAAKEAEAAKSAKAAKAAPPAKGQAETAGQTAAAQAPEGSVKEIQLPNTEPEIRERIEYNERLIELHSQRIATSRAQYFEEADEERRQALQNRIAALSSEIESAEAELKLLRAKLQELSKEGPQDRPASPPPTRPPAPS